MSINKAIENIFEGKLDEMRQNFSAAITSKAVEKLEERKIQIAESYFGQVNESDLPITKKKKKVHRYKHKISGKEISAVKDPGKDWERINEDQLDEALPIEYFNRPLPPKTLPNFDKVINKAVKSAKSKQKSPVKKKK